MSKLIFFFTILMSYQLCFSAICVNTSKIPEFSAGIKFRGYELAFEDSGFSDYKFFTSSSDVDFMNQLQKMTTSDCSIVLGFIISHECFVAGPILKKNKVIGLSTTCSHDDIGRFFPFLYSAHPPVSQQIDVLVDYLGKTQGLGTVFVVHQPTELYSEAQFNQFRKKFPGKFVEVLVGLDAHFDRNQLLVQSGENAAIVFFTYPLPSIKILVDLSSHQLLTKRIRIFGNASWAESFTMLQSLRKTLKDAKEAYVVNILDWGKIKGSVFVKKFRAKFKRDPLDAEILNYDITQFAIQCYREAFINKKFKREKFRYCLIHTKYDGVSGPFSFGEYSSFVERPIYLTNILDRI